MGRECEPELYSGAFCKRPGRRPIADNNLLHLPVDLLEKDEVSRLILAKRVGTKWDATPVKKGNAEIGCVVPKGARLPITDYWTAGCKPRYNVKLRPWYKRMSTKQR
jgi:hypothetical protein